MAHSFASTLLLAAIGPRLVAGSLLQALSNERPDPAVFPSPETPHHLPPAGTNVTGPKSTNKFWANWVVEEGRDLAIHPMPYVLKFESSPPNMKISRSSAPHIVYGDSQTNGPDKVRYYFSPFINEFGLGAVESAGPEGHVVVKEGLFGLHAEVRGPSGTDRRILFPIYSGMAYVSGLYEGFTPQVTSERALLLLEPVADGIWRLLNNGGKEFRLYAIDTAGNFADASFEFGPDGKMNKAFHGWIRLAEVQAPEDHAILDLHAPAVLIDWELDVPGGGAVKYHFTKHASVPTQLLHFAYPHHEKLMTGNTQQVAQLTRMRAPTKGRMAGVTGDQWHLQISTAEEDGLDFLPKTEPRGDRVGDLTQKAVDTLAWFLDGDQWKQAMFKGSYYFSGKGFQKVAYTCLLLEKFHGLASTHTQNCADILKKGFQCLYVPGTAGCAGAPMGLYYDHWWGGAASREGFSDKGCRTADFGNACYNDHHYHFSYFVVSAAALVKLQPEMAADAGFVSFVDTLIRDTTNPSSQDGYFPVFRSFDWFDLHSWSRGVIPSADGKDQESTSEELNLLYGIRLWGVALQRTALRDLGTTMLALCAATIREFFLMKSDNEHHPADFAANHATGIFFQNKVDYATWFGWRYEFIHGIQMLPVTPALLLTRTQEFCRQEWDNVLSRLPLSPTDPWTSLLLTGTLAIIDPEGAYEKLSAMSPHFMDDGLTWVWSLYWSASLSGADAVGSTTGASTTPSAPSGVNVALDRLALASSEAAPELGAARAVDGLFVTYWSPAASDEDPWISVDLGTVQRLSHIVLYWGEFYPLSYWVQAKDDVSDWSTKAVNLGAAGNLQSNMPVNTFARFVRVVCQSSAGSDLRLWEIKVYADEVATTSVTTSTSTASTVAATTAAATTALPTTTTAEVMTTTAGAGTTTEAMTTTAEAVTTTAEASTTSAAQTSTLYLGPNLALTKPVLASSFRSPTEFAFRAVDGDSGTQWASAGSDQWLWVDLLGLHEVHRVVVAWGSEYAELVIQTAPDGIVWTDAATAARQPGLVATEFQPPIQTQWVRVLCRTSCSIRELSIHGGAPSTTTPTAPTVPTTSGQTPVSSGVNLALAHPVLSSSQRSAEEHVSKLVDGSESSEWASAVGEAAPWVWVDLLGVFSIAEVAVHFGDGAAQYTVETSATGEKWTAVAMDQGRANEVVTTPLRGEAKFVRLVFKSLDTSSVSVRELKVFEASSGGTSSMAPSTSSVAKGKPVLASSQLISDFAARAVDDAMGTSWASVPVGEQWIWVDLLTSHDLSHVVIFWGDNIPSSYNLEISSTGVTWEVAVHDVQPELAGEVQTDLAGVKSQWLRVYCKGDHGCSLRELQVSSRGQRCCRAAEVAFVFAFCSCLSRHCAEPARKT
ncbi:unnamed protein product [Effrenium voratum]|uniref:glucan endo-1,3-beta-D-glucosidase n=1 Tax=Effrenium voratum TaxID=2562239 RepID=A0AA36I771_9DINO|nr:unnamed protein product [Effrenium voratum]